MPVSAMLDASSIRFSSAAIADHGDAVISVSHRRVAVLRQRRRGERHDGREQDRLLHVIPPDFVVMAA
jgi:hypothetical protein